MKGIEFVAPLKSHSRVNYVYLNFSQSSVENLFLVFGKNVGLPRETQCDIWDHLVSTAELTTFWKVNHHLFLSCARLGIM